jgi:hypothetical protein
MPQGREEEVASDDSPQTGGEGAAAARALSNLEN